MEKCKLNVIRDIQIKAKTSNTLWEKSQRESNDHKISEVEGPESLLILPQKFTNEENEAQIRN